MCAHECIAQHSTIPRQPWTLPGSCQGSVSTGAHVRGQLYGQRSSSQPDTDRCGRRVGDSTATHTGRPGARLCTQLKKTHGPRQPDTVSVGTSVRTDALGANTSGQAGACRVTSGPECGDYRLADHDVLTAAHACASRAQPPQPPPPASSRCGHALRQPDRSLTLVQAGMYNAQPHRRCDAHTAAAAHSATPTACPARP